MDTQPQPQSSTVDQLHRIQNKIEALEARLAIVLLDRPSTMAAEEPRTPLEVSLTYIEERITNVLDRLSL